MSFIATELALISDETADALLWAAATVLSPLILAAGAAEVKLVELKKAAGRRSNTWVDPFCNACFDVLGRVGAPVSARNEPDPDRPGPLLELANALEHCLPAGLHAELDTWAKRLNTSRKRRRR